MIIRELEEMEAIKATEDAALAAEEAVAAAEDAVAAAMFGDDAGNILFGGGEFDEKGNKGFKVHANL